RQRATDRIEPAGGGRLTRRWLDRNFGGRQAGLSSDGVVASAERRSGGASRSRGVESAHCLSGETPSRVSLESPHLRCRSRARIAPVAGPVSAPRTYNFRALLAVCNYFSSLTPLTHPHKLLIRW